MKEIILGRYRYKNLNLILLWHTCMILVKKYWRFCMQCVCMSYRNKQWCNIIQFEFGSSLGYIRYVLGWLILYYVNDGIAAKFFSFIWITLYIDQQMNSLWMVLRIANN